LHHLDEGSALVSRRLYGHQVFKILEIILAAGPFGFVGAVVHADERPPVNRARRVASEATAAALGQNWAGCGKYDKRDDRRGQPGNRNTIYRHIKTGIYARKANSSMEHEPDLHKSLQLE
jgi:hypothetical protein